MKLSLQKLQILDQAPSSTSSNGRYAECAEGGNDVEVGNEFRTQLPPADVHAFYATAARDDGWRVLRVTDPPTNIPNPQDAGQDIFCGSRDVDGTTVYLEVWYPDGDSGLITKGNPGEVYFLIASLEKRNERTCLAE